jgi:D-3-phosphoglycerate dehydrogenase
LPLRGRTLGIAGLGRIGKAVALRGQCFGMTLMAYDPFPDHEFAKAHNVRLVGWEELVAHSDYLTLHMPATKEAFHIINAQSLSKMKPTAFLINTARGSLVDEAALLEALKSGTIAGAGLDVFEKEPPGDHPFFKLSNVVVMPHAAGVDLQSRDDMAMSAASAIITLSRGGWPVEKVVNPDVRARFRWE